MIDPRACVEPGARLAPGVSVGPWSLVEAGVEIGEGTVIGPHVIMRGPARIGRDSRIHAFCVIGGDPQDKKYRGEPTRLEIGEGNTIREHCTINRGTAQGGGVTRIGDHNWFMANVHIAHDCTVGSHTVFANNTALGGHVSVEDHVILGGYAGVHQFCRVGAYSFAAIAAIIVKDVPPYMMVAGNTARARGLNREGLKRHGYSAAAINALRRAYRILYRQGLTLSEATAQLRELARESAEVQRLVDFISVTARGIVR